MLKNAAGGPKANIYVASTAAGLEPRREAAPHFRMIWIMAHVHCPCSMVYHLHLVFRSFSADDEKLGGSRSSLTRLADLGCVWVPMGGVPRGS